MRASLAPARAEHVTTTTACVNTAAQPSCPLRTAGLHFSWRARCPFTLSASSACSPLPGVACPDQPAASLRPFASRLSRLHPLPASYKTLRPMRFYMRDHFALY